MNANYKHKYYLNTSMLQLQIPGFSDGVMF